LYSYLYDHGKRATISVQPHSANFSTDQFKPTLDFTSHIGRAYVVDLEDRSSAAIVGEKSWVLINAPNKMAADVLQNLINSLEPVRS
ncbi:MAG TPA: hypothetical protein VGO07_00895, partial [Candidatus Saccharimonadales bacterium]|nr:hypothetical protein [Candidatus Saccharimonadales bacterium]